jgi:hypothetical protein
MPLTNEFTLNLGMPCFTTKNSDSIVSSDLVSSDSSPKQIKAFPSGTSIKSRNLKELKKKARKANKT